MGKRKASARTARACNTLLLSALVCIVGVFAARMAEVKGGPPAETSAPGMAAEAAESPAAACTVVVDAGHGGVDGGAVGTRTGVVEAQLNLSVAMALREELAGRGVAVVMTREDGNALAGSKKEDMAARREIMNAEGVDLVVSVHMNRFGDASVSGPMAFYMEGSAEGRRLAEHVIAGVCGALGKSEAKRS